MIKYLVVGGNVTSLSDGQSHYISPRQLMDLYQVIPGDCKTYRDMHEFNALVVPQNAEILMPRVDGQYARRAEELKEKSMTQVLSYVPSSSNPSKSHEIRMGKDGVIYCTCIGWQNHKNCKHLDNWKTKPGAKKYINLAAQLRMQDVVTADKEEYKGMWLKRMADGRHGLKKHMRCILIAQSFTEMNQWIDTHDTHEGADTVIEYKSGNTLNKLEVDSHVELICTDRDNDINKFIGHKIPKDVDIIWIGGFEKGKFFSVVAEVITRAS